MDIPPTRWRGLNSVIRHLALWIGFERDEDIPANLKRGIKFHVEPGTGVYIVPRTHLDDYREFPWK